MFKKSFLAVCLLMSFQAHTMFKKTMTAFIEKSTQLQEAIKYLKKHNFHMYAKQNDNIIELEKFENMENRKKITISCDSTKPLQVSITESNNISIPSPKTPDGGQYDVACYQTTYRKTETWYPNSIDQLLKILKEQVK